MVMNHIADHTVRVLDQEIDTIEICPTAPEYVVVGTYSLIKNEDATETDQQLDPNDNEDTGVNDSKSSSTRVGSLQILPVSHDPSSVQEGKKPELARLDLPCAVLDIRFCPFDTTLLAAATSVGELRFFCIAGLPSRAEPTLSDIDIIPIGIVRLYDEDEQDDEKPPPLITQFAWIEHPRNMDVTKKPSGYRNLQLAVCDTTGSTKLVQVTIPSIQSRNDFRYKSDADPILPSEITAVHKQLYDLEAWTVNIVSIFNSSDDVTIALLSGGDDGCLIGSTFAYEFPDNNSTHDADSAAPLLNIETAPTRFHLDKQTHTAGVVSVVSLIPSTVNSELTGNPSRATRSPVLTGSYDQSLRLFILNHATLKLTYISSIELEGGVWRIGCIDTYTTQLQEDSPKHVNHILLVSAMHAGCYVIRLRSIIMKSNDGENNEWDWKIEARFTGPHESMVYACAAKRVRVKSEHQMWKIISTSFYDKRICVWDWTDECSMSYDSMTTY